jgi:hypothetical protein
MYILKSAFANYYAHDCNGFCHGAISILKWGNILTIIMEFSNALWLYVL